MFRLPRIKEILGKKVQGFEQTDIDFEAIEFKDQNKQKQFEEKKEANQKKLGKIYSTYTILSCFAIEERNQRAEDAKKVEEKKIKQKGKSKSQRRRARMEVLFLLI